MRKKLSPDRTGIDVDIVAGPIHVAGRHGEAAAADAVSQPFFYILNIKLMKDLVSEFKFYGQSSSNTQCPSHILYMLPLKKSFATDLIEYFFKSSQLDHRCLSYQLKKRTGFATFAGSSDPNCAGERRQKHKKSKRCCRALLHNALAGATNHDLSDQARPEVRRDIVSLEKAFKDSNDDGHLGEDKAGRAEVATNAVAASLLCK